MTNIPMIEVVDLTPNMAREMLAGQAPNRAKRWAKIDQFARDMSDGNWIMTGEPIKFDLDGCMIDGQNRCEAVIRSGATIRVLIIRGLARESQSVMDSGTTRTAQDALKFAGYTETKDLQAIISAHRAWKEGAFLHCMANLPSSFRTTNSEAINYAAANPWIVPTAVSARTMYSHGLRLPVGSIATAIAETTAISPAESADFFDRIVNLRTAGVGDPVHTLLKRIDSIRSTGNRVTPSMGLYLLFRSWNAFRTGESLTKFQVGAPAKESGAKATWAKIPEPK